MSSAKLLPLQNVTTMHGAFTLLSVNTIYVYLTNLFFKCTYTGGKKIGSKVETG